MTTTMTRSHTVLPHSDAQVGRWSIICDIFLFLHTTTFCHEIDSLDNRTKKQLDRCN